MTAIDLNCDMGESFGAWRMGDDLRVMPWISSANVACGYHAGDPLTMQATVAAAAAAGVAVGAHVGLPDLAGFGRRAMAVTPRELYAMTVVQVGALAAMARSCGCAPAHVKPHGALYHMLEADPALALALAEAVRDADPSLRLVGFASGQLLRVGRDVGLTVTAEAFADRRYGADGRMLPRGEPGAVIDDPAAAVAQATGLAARGEVTGSDGRMLRIKPDTLCVHGDRDDADAFAQALHEGLVEAGITIRAP